ncbi:MAG: fimbrillin family protein [Bacteroidaceae bacterium]|nr:fimbrillin family protein [Bacteroidaceae bacterium]
MKRKYLTIAALAAIVAGCSSDEALTPQVDNLKDTPITVSAGVEGMKTRAGYGTDATDDTQSVLPATFYLGIDQTGDDYDYPNMLMTKAEEGNAYTPESQLLWASGTENATVTAATFPLDGAQTLTVLADQSTAEGVTGSDHLLMTGKAVAPSAEGISVEFSHLMSKVLLTITLGDEFNEAENPFRDVTFKGTVASNSYTAGTGWAEIAADATATDITPLCNAYTAPATNKPNATAGYEVVLLPQTVAAGGFSVQFNVGDRMFKWTSASDVTLAGGYEYTLALTAGKDKVTLGGITASKWTTSATGSDLKTE